MEEERSVEEITPVKRKVRIIRRPRLETWTWPEIITNYIPYSWDEVFARTEQERQTIAQVLVDKFFSRQEELSPRKERVYHAFELTPFHRVRVVLVGQDPYPQLGKAQGLSFSIGPDDRSLPGSLRNIYRELAREYPDYVPPVHGDLSSWSRQGVLLLNMALTVPIGQRNAHRGLWRPFIFKTLREIVEKKPETIFILWGNEAQKIQGLLGNAPVLVSGHPSPEAVNRGGNFIGNGHFQKVNQILLERGQEPINWQV